MQKTQKSLVKRLITEGVIKNMEVAHVMEQVDRKYYTSKYPYEDTPQPIGFGATISAPHMHAYALEYLYDKLKTAKYALDVGSGTGYLTAAMALITPSDCIVYGIEHVGELVQISRENIHKGNPELQHKVIIEKGDGRKGWTKQNISFDVIHVGAAASIIPEALIDQLAEGGKMVIPVGGDYEYQTFLEINKIEGKIVKKNICSVRYVPLTDLKKQVQ